MAKDKKVGVHGTDKETGRAKGEKRPCPVTKDDFLEKAKAEVVKIEGLGITAVMQPKHFSSGSLGLFTNGKAVVVVDGVPCEATFQAQVILNNSKPGGDAE